MRSHVAILLRGRAHAIAYGLNGERTLLCEFVVGDLFGALDSSHRWDEGCDVQAVEAAATATLLSLDLVQLIEVHTSLAVAVIRSLSRQLAHTGARITERAVLSAPGRVHAELLRLAKLNDGHEIRPVPVLSALADRVQTTRETVSRAVNALQRRGIIRRDPDALVIIAPGRLEELVV